MAVPTVRPALPASPQLSGGGVPASDLRSAVAGSPDQGRQSGFQEFAGAWAEDGGKNQEGSVSVLTRRSLQLCCCGK